MPNYDNNNDYNNLKAAARTWFKGVKNGKKGGQPEEWTDFSQDLAQVNSPYETLPDEWLSRLYRCMGISGVSPAYLEMAQQAILVVLYEEYMSEAQQVKAFDMLNKLNKQDIAAFADQLRQDIDAINGDTKQEKQQEILNIFEINAKHYNSAASRTKNRLLVERLIVSALALLLLAVVLVCRYQSRAVADDEFSEKMTPLVGQVVDAQRGFEDSWGYNKVLIEDLKARKKDLAVANEALSVIDSNDMANVVNVANAVQTAKARLKALKFAIADSDQNVVDAKMHWISAIDACNKAYDTFKDVVNRIEITATSFVFGDFGALYLWTYRRDFPGHKTLAKCTGIQEQIETDVVSKLKSSLSKP